MTIHNTTFVARHRLGWMAFTLLAIALGLGACAQEPWQTEASPEQQAADAANLKSDAVGPQERTDGQPAPSASLDKIAPVPAPGFNEKTELSAPVAYRDKDMPAYNGAELPAQTESMTLDQVYMMALQNDPQLHGVYKELRAMGYGVMAARAGMLPSVSGQFNRNQISQDVISSDNTVYQHGSASWPETGWALSLTQPIFDLGVYQKWRQSQDAERKQTASYAAAQQDLMLRTAIAYLSILAAQDQIELTEAERRATEQQMELVRARFQSGQKSQVDVSEVQARLDLQQANTLLAHNDYLDKQQALLEIIGFGNVKLRRVRKDLPLDLPEPNDPQIWLRTALEQNWSLRAAAAAVSIAEREAKVQKAGYWPNLGLQVTTGRNETGGSLFGGGSTIADTRVLLNLNVPLFQSGYTYGMSHAAVERLRAAQSDLSLARRKVQRQVFSSYQNIIIGIDRIKALDSSVRSFELTLEQKQAGFKAGLNDNVSVLDTMRNLYNAKRQQAEAVYNFLLDGLKLKQAAGTLNAADIAAISQKIM
ncbi:MAG: TolC family outer membrane protein [Desulfobulbus sp.]|nr:TolC family outer membrane protein [Desulfobulbus sp.]